MAPVGYAPTADAYGTYGAVSPDMLGGDMGSGGDMSYGGEMGGGGGCPYCGGTGCDMCSSGHGHGLCNGLLGDVFGLVAPYGDGGCGAVRWFDVAVDGVFLTRDNRTADIVLSTFGQAGVNGIALTTGQLGFDFEGGFRFTGQIQVGPGSDLEFTYLGPLHYHDQITVERLSPDPTDGLFSVFSAFGTVPPGGFVETDNADLHSVSYSSTLDSFELNFRQRYMAPNCRYQGSWLWGARFVSLNETLAFLSLASQGLPPGDPPRSLNALTDTNNSLTGLQIGGDYWVCLLPGLRLGAEAKAGVFYNHMNVDSVFIVNTQPLDGVNNPFFEEQIKGDIAFVGEVNLQATYRVSYSWTLRGGVQGIFIDGVALAPDNFNPVPPAGPFGPGNTNRVPFVSDDGNVFYYGFTAGVEYLW
ncbi:MAG TPA: hypothetical protein VFV87_14870 [Pirellulaceae bacterium]|nr:hypothetical protein [Pirellulaceae bacterium]